MEILTALGPKKNHFIIKIICLFIIFCFILQPNTVLSLNNPSNYWSMDEIVGQTYGNPEIISNDCIKDKCINFDGQSKIVTTTDLSSKTDVQDIATYSFWFKTGSDIINIQYLLTQNLNFIFPGSLVREGRGVFIKDGEIGIFTREKGYTWKEIRLMTINPDSWYFLTLVQDQSTLIGYINGTFVKSISFTGSMTSYSNSWGIACLTYQNVWLFTGKLDDITVYPTALSSTDIKNLYNSYNVIPIPQDNSQPNQSLYIDLFLTSMIVFVPIFVYIRKRTNLKHLNRPDIQKSINNEGTIFNSQILSKKNICIKCNHIIKPYDKFCENCGCQIISI